LEGEFGEEGYFQQFVADVFLLFVPDCLFGPFDPDVVHFKQSDPVDGCQFCLSLVEIEH
jgi:hypothetical protein